MSREDLPFVVGLGSVAVLLIALIVVAGIISVDKNVEIRSNDLGVVERTIDCEFGIVIYSTGYSSGGVFAVRMTPEEISTFCKEEGG